MKKLLVTLLALLGLATLGTVAWLALARPVEDAVAAAASDPFEAATPEDSGELSPASETSVPGELESVERSEAEAPPPPPAEPAGTRLLGRLLDTDAKPVAGATVYAALRSRGPPTPLDMEPWNQRDRKRRAATSGADGRFVLEDVSAGSTRVAARSAEYAPYDVDDVLVLEGQDHDLGDLTLVAGVRVAGRVVDSRGQPVAGASLYRPFDTQNPGYRGALGTGVRLAETDALGRFDVGPLSPGPWVLLAHHDLHPDGVARGEDSAPGERVHDVRIQFEASASITGVVRVSAGAGAPKPDMFSIVASYTGSRERAPGEPDHRWRRTRCAADGSYVLAGLLEDEPYRLTVHWHRKPDDHDGGEMPGLARDAVADGSRIDFELQPFAVLAYRPVDASSGAALEKVDGRLVAVQPDGREYGVLSTTTDEGGGRWTETSARIPPPQDTLTLIISKDGYRPLRKSPVTIAASSESDAGVVRLEPLAQVRVRVVSAETGEPIEGARVQAQLASGDDGTQTLEALAAGRERERDRGPARIRSRETDRDGWTALFASADASGVACATHSEWPSSELVDVTFGPAGASTVELRMVPGANAHVRVVDRFGAPAAGVSVRARWQPPPGSETEALRAASRRVVTDSTGVALFERLLAGPTSFALEEERVGAPRSTADRDGAATTVTLVVAATAEVELLATPRGTLRGRVLDAGQRLAGATLELRPGSTRDAGNWRGDDSRIVVKTDSEGRYVVPRLGAGRWSVTITHALRLVAHREDLVFEGLDTQRDFRLSGSAVTGTVVDTRGRGIGGARIVIGELRPDRNARDGKSWVPLSTNARVLSDEGGWYELRGLPSGVELQVSVEHPEHQGARSDTFRLETDEVRAGVDVKLRPGATLLVEVQSSDGRVVRARVTAQRIADEKGKGVRSGPRTVNLDGRARARLTGLAGGRYAVSLDRAFGGQAKPARQELELEVGRETTLRIDVP